MTRRDVPGTVYLLHLVPPYKHARHYLGFAEGDQLAQRLAEHGTAHGARLLAVAKDAGHSWHLVRTWQGTRALERQIKDTRHVPHYCPECQPQRSAARREARASSKGDTAMTDSKQPKIDIRPKPEPGSRHPERPHWVACPDGCGSYIHERRVAEIDREAGQMTASQPLEGRVVSRAEATRAPASPTRHLRASARMTAWESLQAHARYFAAHKHEMSPQEAARYGARIVRLSDAARGRPRDDRWSMPRPLLRAVSPPNPEKGQQHASRR